MRRRSRRWHARGQSMVEMCLIAPALVTLAAGGGQVGIIAYGGASVETPARAATPRAAGYPDKPPHFIPALGLNPSACGHSPTRSPTPRPCLSPPAHDA